MISVAIEFIGTLIILTAFEMLGQSYIKPLINTMAFQSVLLAILIAILGFQKGSLELIILAILTLVVRGYIVPHVMKWNIRGNKIWDYREMTTGVPALVITGIFLTVIGYGLYQTAFYPLFKIRGGALPIILLLLGFLLIIARKNALAQMVGYIMEENALLYAGTLLIPLSFILEAGILLDVIGLILLGVILAEEREYGILEIEELRG
ncbi:hydrogenase 4 membrane subunit [archaeon]|nr:hydrogenase 4 membrane subunit [archaeon]